MPVPDVPPAFVGQRQLRSVYPDGLFGAITAATNLGQAGSPSRTEGYLDGRALWTATQFLCLSAGRGLDTIPAARPAHRHVVRFSRALDPAFHGGPDPEKPEESPSLTRNCKRVSA